MESGGLMPGDFQRLLIQQMLLTSTLPYGAVEAEAPSPLLNEPRFSIRIVEGP